MCSYFRILSLLLLMVSSLSLQSVAQPSEETPTFNLFKQIRYGNLDGVKRAIQDGADLSSTQDLADIHADPKTTNSWQYVYGSAKHGINYYNPLTYAYRYAGSYNISNRAQSLKIIKALLDAGADGNGLLNDAAFYGDFEVVQIVGSEGKKIDFKKCDNLVAAVQSKNLATVKFLLEKGADPNCRSNNFGQPVLTHAASPEIVDVLLHQHAKLGPSLVEDALRESHSFPFVPFAEIDNPDYYNAGRDKAIARMVRAGASLNEWMIDSLMFKAKGLNFRETIKALEERHSSKVDKYERPHAETVRPEAETH